MKKILFITGTRADYGKIKSLIKGVDEDKNLIYAKPHKVNAVDTTGAGDSYLGALVTKLADNADILDAMSFATLASAYTVTKKGAIIALPHLEDLENFI